MSVYTRIVIHLMVLSALSCAAQSQSYDAGDGKPPEKHTLSTYEVTPISILFDEKYRLLVDVDCKTDQLIVDVKLKGGSVANTITVVGDSIIYISMMPSAESRRQQITGNIIVATAFKVLVNLDTDTATFYVNYADDTIDVSLAEECWFIEAEPLLQLPPFTIWIISDDLKYMNKIKDSLTNKNTAQYMTLSDGYYQCFPTGYVWERYRRNECIFGPVLFFNCNDEHNYQKAELIVRNLAEKLALFGSNI